MDDKARRQAHLKALIRTLIAAERGPWEIDRGIRPRTVRCERAERFVKDYPSCR